MAALSPTRLFLYMLAFRTINALCVTTFFQPDEYFQALEPAWRLAFGPDSGAWITWEWKHRIRSSLHPTLFSLAYVLADKLCSLAPFLRPTALLVAPKLLQAVFAAGSDWGTWRLATSIYGRSSPVSLATAALTLVSPWQWYCSTRTLSNSLETTLTTLALSFWPWSTLSSPSAHLTTITTTAPIKENPKPARRQAPLITSHVRISLTLAALAVILRPTNLFVWAPIAGLTVVSAAAGPALVLIREAVLCGAAVLALSAGVDRIYFAEWTFPAYNWLHFNISQSIAVFYGRSGWHYYLTQALPVLCTTCLPFALLGLWRPSGRGTTASQQAMLRILASGVYTSIAVLSFVAHKEWRFIYPLLPIIHVLAAPYAAIFFLQPSGSQQSTPTHASVKPRHKTYLINAIALNVLTAIFLSNLQQPAAISVLSFLRNEYAALHPHLATASPSSLADRPNRLHQNLSEEPDALFALFLAQCHSTPWRSHLLYPTLTARALTCEPPLHTAPETRERREYRDESTMFFDDPVGFMERELWPMGRQSVSSIPKHIIGFEGIEPWLHEFFGGEGKGQALGMEIERVWEGWNGFFSDDARRKGKLMVWRTVPKP